MPTQFQAVPITTFSLGCWQVKRKSWKEELIKQMESKLHLASGIVIHSYSHSVLNQVFFRTTS